MQNGKDSLSLLSDIDSFPGEIGLRTPPRTGLSVPLGGTAPELLTASCHFSLNQKASRQIQQPETRLIPDHLFFPGIKDE